MARCSSRGPAAGPRDRRDEAAQRRRNSRARRVAGRMTAPRRRGRRKTNAREYARGGACGTPGTLARRAGRPRECASAVAACRCRPELSFSRSDREGGGRVRRLAAVAATTLGLVLGVAAAHGQRSEPGLAVRNVRVERIGGGRRVTVTLTHPPEGVRGSRLDNPLRLEIDIDSPQAEAGGETRFPVAGEVVSGVRAAPRAGGLSVVLDLKRDPGPAAVRAEGAEVIADLGEAYVSRAGLGVGLGGKR